MNIEQQFFKTFGIEMQHFVNVNNNQFIDAYPKITAEILLQLLCIYNDMQGCVELCIAPCSYEDTKDMILNTLINEKLNINDYEEGTYMDVMTKRIRALFGGEE